MMKAAMDSKPKQTTLYLWQGMNKQGQRIRGQIHADSLNHAKQELSKQGILLLSLKPKAKSFLPSRHPPIKPVDIAIFSRLLATMLSAGVPMMQALHIIGDSNEHAQIQNMVVAIKVDVASGSSLSEALGKFRPHFSDLYLSLINAGEQSGTLEMLLDDIASYQEKTEALKAKIKKALVYPSAIILVALIVIMILLVFVIPQFQSLFNGSGADLPSLTRWVIHLSELLLQYGWLILIAITALILSTLKLHQNSLKTQRILDRILLKLPVINLLIRKAAIARFARTFSIMFKAGVPLIDVMTSVAGTTGNAVYADATIMMRDSVATGIQLNKTLLNTSLFPSMVVQMVKIGEESGYLDAMLEKIADIYEGETSDAVDNLTTLLEPLIMVFLGIILGTLVIAMYWPVFQLGSVI